MFEFIRKRVNDEKSILESKQSLVVKQSSFQLVSSSAIDRGEAAELKAVFEEGADVDSYKMRGTLTYMIEVDRTSKIENE